MKIADEAELATRMVRRIKEEMVRKHKGRVDLETTLTCYRGETPVALLTLPPARRSMLQVARIAAQGFGPDVLSVSNDSFMAAGTPDKAKDPRTGEVWKNNPGDGPGAMQTYVEQFGFDGTITESLITNVLNRAGDCVTVVQPYEVVGRDVVWTELGIEPGMEFTGDVPNGLRQAMSLTTIDQKIPAWAYELVDGDLEKARWHMDMATVRLIELKVEVPVVVQLFAKKGSPRDQLFRTKLARSQVVDPARWN